VALEARDKTAQLAVDPAAALRYHHPASLEIHYRFRRSRGIGAMPRCVLVGLLIFSLTLAGCTSHQPWLKPLAGDSTPDWVWYPDWLDNYPILKGPTYLTACTLLLIGVGLGIGAGVILYLWA